MTLLKKVSPFLIGLIIIVLVFAYRESITRTIRGDAYVEQQQKTKETKEALNADTSAFPQLSDKVGKQEAKVILHTSMGDVTIKLFPKLAPKASENFLTHAKEGYYNGVSFHRVIKDFMVQSGDPKGDGTGGESIWGKDFANEISPYLYNIRGALAMANTGSDTSNGSQFYIVQNEDNQSADLSSSTYPKPIIKAYKKGGYPAGDGKYTVFGQVISGMDVIDKIASTETDSSNKPKETITITSIEVVKDYHFN